MAELAREELKRLGRSEKPRGRQPAVPTASPSIRSLQVPLNVNGQRVMTTVHMPNPIVDNQTIFVAQKTGGYSKKKIFNCAVCLIDFKTPQLLQAHFRSHNPPRTLPHKKTQLMTTKALNMSREVRMKIFNIGLRRTFHVLLPLYDYAFVVTNSTEKKLYMKCYRSGCSVKAYSTNDGKFYIKEGDQHTHGPEASAILDRINSVKQTIMHVRTTPKENLKKIVTEEDRQKERQKNLIELKKMMMIEKVKKAQRRACGEDSDDESGPSRKVKKHS